MSQSSISPGAYSDGNYKTAQVRLINKSQSSISPGAYSDTLKEVAWGFGIIGLNPVLALALIPTSIFLYRKSIFETGLNPVLALALIPTKKMGGAMNLKFLSLNPVLALALIPTF